MKKRKQSLLSPKFKKKAIDFRPLTQALVLLVLVFCVGVYACVMLRRLSTFRIKEVIVKESYRLNDPVQALLAPPVGSIDLSYLKGGDIFSLNLSRESARILKAYPQYKRVRLIKVFPNQVFVHCIRRTAFAMIKLRRYFFVGEDLVLSAVPMNMETQIPLPVITGLDKKIPRIQAGQRYYVPELMLAIGILREMYNTSDLKEYQLVKIDVSNAENTSIYVRLPGARAPASAQKKQPVPVDLEIKIGQDNIRQKLGLLSELFSHYRQKLGMLEYVDLRFKEPVIKLKDEKK